MSHPRRGDRPLDDSALDTAGCEAYCGKPVKPDANGDAKVADCVGIHQSRGAGGVRLGGNDSAAETEEEYYGFSSMVEKEVTVEEWKTCVYAITLGFLVELPLGLNVFYSRAPLPLPWISSSYTSRMPAAPSRRFCTEYVLGHDYRNCPERRASASSEQDEGDDSVQV